MVRWSACKKQIKETTAFYHRLFKVWKWTPLSRAVPISAQRHYIFEQFQDDFYYISLRYLYILYTLMCISFLVMFVVKDYNQWQWTDTRPKLWFRVIALFVFNIVFHPLLFIALKIKAIRWRIRKFIVILNVISQSCLYAMSIVYGMSLHLTENHWLEVARAILLISMSTFYFQGSLIGSSIAWAVSCAGCLAQILSEEDRGSYVEVVSHVCIFK